MQDLIDKAQRLAFTKLAIAMDRHWNSEPFGNAPRASKAEYIKRFDVARATKFPQIDELEQTLGFSIDGPWLDELALHTQIAIKRSDLAYPHGRLLYSLLRRYLADNPQPFVTVVETGTGRGFSAICLAKALDDAAAAGHVVSFDVLPHNHRIYWNCIDDCDGKKTRSELLKPWQLLGSKVVFIQGDSLYQLPRVGLDRVNFAFIDAHHTKENVLSEYDYIASRQEPGDVIVFDDVTPGAFDGVVAAVDHIEGVGLYQIARLGISRQRAYAWGIRR